MAGPGTLIALPAALQEAVQQGFLEAEYRMGLDSVLAYGQHAVSEPMMTNVGEEVTKTRAGKKAPATTPITAATINSNLDNGLTPSLFAMEQFKLTMQQYADTANVNLLQAKAALKNHVLVVGKNSATQAEQSKERLARNALFNSYMGGNSRVLNASLTTTTCAVDDVRGFEYVLVNGKVTAVSGATPLVVYEKGTTPQTLSVTGVARDVTNISKAAVTGGWSGVLTFATATTPTANDVLEAANAPKILRAGGRTNTRAITSSDLFTIGLVEDGVAYLRDQGTPTFEDGFYHCVLDNTSGRQLFGDTEFQNLYRGLAKDRDIRKGVLAEIAGVRYMYTTEAPVQTDNGAATPLKVRRPMLIGGEALVRGDFQGVEQHVAEMNPVGIHDMQVIDNIAFVLRPPLDRLGQMCALSWYYIGDFCCPTDLTTDSTIIPTAGSSSHKRALVFEHYGGS